MCKKRGGGGNSRSQRETMQMWEGEIGGSREKCPRYVYGIHTELCRTHETQIEEDKAFGEMGAGCDTDVRGEASTSTGDRGSTSFWRGEGGGGGSGVEVDGIRQHARANLKCNHHWKNVRVYTFQRNEKKRHSWVSVKILKMPSNCPTFFFSS